MSISTLPFIKHLQGRLNLKLKSASNDFVLLQHVLCNASVINVGKYYYYYYTIRCNMQEANEEKHKPVALQSCIFFLWFCLLLFLFFLILFLYIFFFLVWHGLCVSKQGIGVGWFVGVFHTRMFSLPLKNFLSPLMWIC